MQTLYVIGGQEKDKPKSQDLHLFKKGVVLRIDPKSGASETCVEYITPANACAAEQDPAILFKAGTIEEDRLYLCTQTEVLVYTLPHFERIAYVSLPSFNDLHHVRPTPEGNLLVANSGLDLVMELTLDGQVLREWDVLGGEPWTRFSRDIDYRQILTTKPHKSHPNYVFRVGQDSWVTRFEQSDAICLTRPGGRMRIGLEKPHDGIVYGESVYFTTVDGHVAIVNLRTERLARVINLNGITDTDRALGWCRGLEVLDEEHVVVGFSRFRPTKFRENLRWVKRRFHLSRTGSNLPTRVALYDLKSEKLLWECNLEELGLNAVFSVHASNG